MKKCLGKLRRNEQGSVLLTVLTIMTFATVLAAAAFGFVRTASVRSTDNVNEKQSYYTASTCLETFIDSVMEPENANWDEFVAVAELGGTSDPITIEGMGTCTISVEKPAGLGYIKVTSTAVVNDREESVVCYLKAATEPGDADFDNAIELTSNSNSAYDNLNVMGDVAGSNDTNSDMVYKFDNESHVYGKYFQYGTIQNLNHIFFHDGVTGDGASLTASKYIAFGKNEIKISSQIKKQNNNASNYVCAGNTFTTNNTRTTIGESSDSVDVTTGAKANDVDLFAHGIVFGIDPASSSACDYSKAVANEFSRLASASSFEVGSDVDMPYYIQYGNVYCYANGGANTSGKTDAELAGNLVCDNKAQVTITGDVFVEGNLYIASNAKLTVYGNLYVKGSIIGTPTVSADSLRANTGKIYCSSYAGKTGDLDASAFEGFKTGRGAFPPTTYQGTKFLYYAEDLLVSTDSNVSTISSKYKAVVTNKDAYKVSRFTSGSEDGVNFDLVITDSCYIGKDDLGSDTDDILVKVTSDDIVIVLEDGTNLNNGKRIMVKNTTKSYENSDSLSPKFCYITVDTYTSSAKVQPVFKTDASGNPVLDEKGNKIVIDSRHTGFKTSASISMDNCIIGDFDTWKNADVGYQVDGKSSGTKPLNLTGQTVANTYMPENGKGYIIMLLTEGTQINAQNACQIEATVFGRQASIKYQATAPSVKYETGNSSVSKEVSKNTFAIGSLVLGQLSVQNTSWISYCPPSNKSNLSNLGGSGASKIKGYEVLKYTQNLS